MTDNNQQLLEYVKDLQEKDKMNKQLIQNLIESMDSKNNSKNKIIETAFSKIK